MNAPKQYLIKEAERLAGAQIHHVINLISTYCNWFAVLERRTEYKDVALLKIKEYEEILSAYIQLRSSGQYPNIGKLKSEFLSKY